MKQTSNNKAASTSLNFSFLPAGLPQPDAESQSHCNAVAQVIREAMNAQAGLISFARFMDLALYSPGLGYYSAGSRKFGATGDFVTAPEISPLFSQCLAQQAQQVLGLLGGGDILEIGAGSGVMACDVLLELEQLGSLPGSYFILEVSADLRERQQCLLKERIPELVNKVVWLDTMPEPEFCGLVLVNEVLDAMAVHRFSISPDSICESHVKWLDGRFVWQEVEFQRGRLFDYLTQLRNELGDDTLFPGYLSEVNLVLHPWMALLAQTMARGVALIIDYGFVRREYYHPDRSAGTIMCHYRHRSHPDPLILPGLQDMTAHVDFTAVAEAASAARLDVLGFTTQAHFLLACGLDKRVAASDPNDVRQHLALTQQVKTLTLPSEMGELFKVIALGKNVDDALLGFSFTDLRGRL